MGFQETPSKKAQDEEPCFVKTQINVIMEYIEKDLKNILQIENIHGMRQLNSSSYGFKKEKSDKVFPNMWNLTLIKEDLITIFTKVYIGDRLEIPGFQRVENNHFQEKQILIKNVILVPNLAIFQETVIKNFEIQEEVILKRNTQAGNLTIKDPTQFRYLRETKIILQVSLRSKCAENLWYIDSGCSKHMTGDRNLFTKLEKKDYGDVSFGDNNKGKLFGRGTVGTTCESSQVQSN